MMLFDWVRKCFGDAEKRMDDASTEIRNAINGLDSDQVELVRAVTRERSAARDASATDEIAERRANEMADLYLNQIEVTKKSSSILTEEIASIQRAKSAKKLLKALKKSDVAKRLYY